MAIRAHIPAAHFNRISYTLSVLIEDWLGLPLSYEAAAEAETRLEIGPGTLILADEFFCKAHDPAYLKRELADEYELNIPPALQSPAVAASLPLLFGPNQDIQLSAGRIRITGSILGSAFFLLSGYEAYLNPPQDRYGRQAAGDSCLKRHLARPLANEYAELLLNAIKLLAPAVSPQSRAFTVRPTHDIDHPYQFYRLRPHFFLKNAAGDLLERHKFQIERYSNYAMVNLGYRPDPFDTFNYILKKENGLQATYYFFAGANCGPRMQNPDYRLSESHIARLMARIKDSGQTIGLHCGLGTSDNLQALRREAQHFRNITRIEQPKSRQHYLNIKVPDTWRHLDVCGVSEDSSYCFRDAPGFRAGACLPYQVYDYELDRRLALIERPLILMESSLLDRSDLDGQAIRATILALKQQVRKVNGEFVFLWHNHRLTDRLERELYEFTLKA